MFDTDRPIREGLRLARSPMPSAFVPRDKRLANMDDGHFNGPRSPLGGIALRGLQKLATEPVVLQTGTHGECAQVPLLRR